MNQCGESLEGFPLAGCIYSTFWQIPVLLRPTGGGGTEWSPTSYGPLTGFIYVNASETTSTLARRAQLYEPGHTYTGGASVTAVCATVSSTFTALDSRTHKIAWQKQENMSQGYGSLSTAGGLTFRGKIDGNLLAHDSRTGDDLWSFPTGWGISAPPMTYSVDGTQYVAVASGGNRGGVTTTDGDAMWAFALNGTIDELPTPPAVQTKITITGRQVKIGDTIGTPGAQYDDVVFDGTSFMEDYRFVPTRVSVPVSTTLTWKNNGATTHTATDTKGASDTGEVAPGQSASVTLNTAGTYTYSCLPHPWMIADIQVT